MSEILTAEERMEAMRLIRQAQCMTPWAEELAFSDAARERRIAALGGWVRRLQLASRAALIWFNSFGYNKYGIAVKDDIPDHAPVEAAIREALAEEEP